MQRHTNRYLVFLILSVLFLATSQLSFAQTKDTVTKAKDTITFSSAFNFGPYDTIIVPAHPIDGDTLAARYYSTIWVVKPMPPAMRRRLEEWTRLRNAVYVTYPFAKKAGAIMNDMNGKLAKMNSEDEKKTYIKSREKELKKEFADPLTNLSVYQGKILMKLINRQTGNNCYNIIKEYKGGFTARFWQTVAFFFGSSLKQPYDAKGDDQQIERIVQEMERMYHG
ncbi:MAG: DUF4294 domain-containing protein [Bacteroidetes bacterium]|nr:DUF4294 domain-containing protein [Bacteroidota bacterium]MBS1935188.1 DUF4294 domain-containing protein [Bacteroidota bacterium]